MRRPLKWLAWGGATLVVLLAVLVAGVWGMLGTETGRRFVADRIEQAASDANLSLRIGRLAGALPGQVDLEDITLADRNGPVARIDLVSVSWHPLALLSKRLDVERIALSGVTVERLPAEPQEQPPKPGGMPPLATGFEIDIAAISANEILLGPAIAGSAAHLSAAGSFALAADASRARIGLDVRRIDGADGRASLVLDYAAEPARFAARLDVEEPSGGPIAALAGLPGEFPLAVRLDGAGPPEAWRGRLVGTAGPSRVELDLFVGVAARVLSLRIDGTAQAGPLLPAPVASVLGTSAQISTALSFGPETGWRIERASLAGERLALSGSGSYLPGTGAITGEAMVETRAAAGPLRLAEVALGAARVTARLSGTAPRPAARIELSGSEIATSLARVASVQGGFDLAPAEDGRLSVKGDARLSGIVPDAQVPAGLLGSDATIAVDASWLPGGGFAIGRLALTSDGLSVTAEGRSEDGVALAGSYEVAKSGIGILAGSAALGGDLRLGGGYRVDLARLAGEVELVGDLGDLRGSGALLGPSVALTGAVARAEDGRIDLIGLEIGGAGGSLRARASLDPAGSVTAGHVAASLPDLSRLAAADIPLSGRARLEADISGPLEALEGTGRLRLEKLATGAVSLDEIAIGIGFKAAGAGVSGSVRVALAKESVRLPGAFRFALDGPRLRVADILFSADGNQLSGDLQVDLASGLATGAIDARLADLASLGLAAPGQVSGALTLGVKLDAAAGQRVTLSGSGTALRIGGATEAETVSIGGLTLAATVEDALGARRIAGKIEARDMTARDQAAVSRAALEVSTDRDGTLRFDGAVDGHYGDPLSLRLAGSSAATGEGLMLELTGLSGSAGGVKLESTAPARVVVREDKSWRGSLALRVGGGNVTATAAVDPESVALSLVVAEMPVAALAATTRHLDPGATWSARIDLSGAPANPRGALAVSAKGLRPAGAAWSAADALALSLDGTLADGRVALEGRISGPDATELTAAVSVPLRLSLAPAPLFEIPDAPVSGRAALRGRLEMIEALVDIGENWLSGAAAASVVLAGTTRAPEIRGSAELSGGRFEGVQTGLVVREIEVGLQFDGTRLRIARLGASDSEQGRLTGSGEVRLDGEGWPVDLTLTFARFAALARDDATLAASGEVRVLGTVSAPRIEGRLTVDGGEIRIPDKIGTSAVSLDVVEINLPGGTPSAAKVSKSDDPAPAGGAGGIALDVTVLAPGRVFVRGRGLDSEWSGDLKIGGTTAQPVIAGVLSVVRGSFALAGRTLAVDQGSVTFRAGQLDPEIDTRATLSLAGSEITVQVSGRASAPAISLSSVPSKPTEEILALMLFGKSAGALTAFQAAQLARSAAALSGNFSGDSILDRARRGLGVDALTVESQGDTARGTALKAGKYVADGVFVTVQQGASSDSQKVGVEIEVTPSITVETGVGPSAGNSIGLNWKLDY